MKKVLPLIATVLTVSAAIFSLAPEAGAAFVPNPGPSQPGPAQPPQTQPQPQQVPPQPAPQYQPRVDGTWQTTSDNFVGYVIIAGNQYQIWMNNQMTESGTLTVQGSTFYEQPNGGQPRSENFQLSPDGMTLTILGAQGSTTFQRVQNTPSQPSPQPMPSPMPQPQPPTYPQPAQPGYPQPAPPSQNLQAQLQGAWGAYTNGSQQIVVFNGNQFAASVNNQTTDYGTYMVRGNMIYYNSTTGALNNYSVTIQMAPDGRSLLASDSGDAYGSGITWYKIQ
jgi:hypothetical protein